jgi:hypothetical protein
MVIGGFAAILVLWAIAEQLALERYQDNRQAHAISESEYQSVADSATSTALLSRFGEPEDENALDERGEGCLTYKEQGAPLLRERTYRFCFEGGQLILKDFAPIEDPDELRSGAILEGD